MEPTRVGDPQAEPAAQADATTPHLIGPGAPDPATMLLGLQRSAGNRAVGRLLAGAPPPRRGVARADSKGSFATVRERMPDVADPQRIGGALAALQGGDLENAAAALTDADARALDVNQRAGLIDALARLWVVDYRAERAIIRLIRTTPNPDCATLINWLRADKAALLHALEAAMDGEQYLEYHRALKDLFERSMTVDRMAAMAESARSLPWGDPPHARAAVGSLTFAPVPRFHYEELDLEADGLVHISYMNGGMLFEYPPSDPFDLVLVLVHYDEPEVGAAAGQVLPMPAINLLVLSWKQFRQEMATAVNTGLLVGGGVSGLYATTRMGMAIAALDTALGAAGTVIQDYRTEIAKSPGGQLFLQAWDVVQWLIALYTLKNVVVGAPGMFRTLRERWRVWRGLGLEAQQVKKLEQKTEELLEKAEEIEQVVNTPPRVYRKPAGPNANEPVKVSNAQMPPVPVQAQQPGELEALARELVDPEDRIGFDIWAQGLRAKGADIEKVLTKFDAPRIQDTARGERITYHKDVAKAQEAERLRLRAQDDPFEPILKNNEQIEGGPVWIHYENLAPSADEIAHAKLIAQRTGDEVHLFGDTAHGVTYPGIDGTIGNPKRPLQLKTMKMGANAEAPRGMAQIALGNAKNAGYSGVEVEIFMPGKTVDEVKAAWNVTPTVKNAHELLDYYESDVIEKITIMCKDGGVWEVPKGLPLTGPLPEGI